VTYNDLTLKEIEKSVRRAEEERQKKVTTKSKRWKNHPKSSKGVPHPNL